MKMAIRCLICILLMAFAWVTLIEIAYSVPAPTTKRVVVGMCIFIGTMLISTYIVEPSIINKRIYAIMVCIGFHRKIRKYCSNKLSDIVPSKIAKQQIFEYQTGCRNYSELYSYAKKEYLKR